MYVNTCDVCALLRLSLLRKIYELTSNHHNSRNHHLHHHNNRNHHLHHNNSRNHHLHHNNSRDRTQLTNPARIAFTLVQVSAAASKHG